MLRPLPRSEVLHANRSLRRQSSDAGFTLVELLIVLSILVLLASLIGPRVVGYLGASKTKVAKVQIESLVTALQLFRIDTGRFHRPAGPMRPAT